MPRAVQLGWERGQLDTLLNPNRSVNGAAPVAGCASMPEAVGACVMPHVSTSLPALSATPDSARTECALNRAAGARGSFQSMACAHWTAGA